MDIKECFEKGLLKRDIKDIRRSAKSIEAAKRKIEIAKKTFDVDILEESIINAYASMFHASRAILFRDGVKEKSHYAVYVYLREMYKEKIEARFLNEFNSLRMERHELIYGLEKSKLDKTETQNIILIAEEFVKMVEKLIGLK